MAVAADICLLNSSHNEHEEIEKSIEQPSVNNSSSSEGTNNSENSTNVTDNIDVDHERPAESQDKREEITSVAVNESITEASTQKRDVVKDYDTLSLRVPDECIENHEHSINPETQATEAVTGEKEDKILEEFHDHLDKEALESHSENLQDLTSYTESRENRSLKETFLSASQPATSNRTSIGIHAYEKLAKRFKPPPKKADLSELKTQLSTQPQSKEKNNDNEIGSQDIGCCLEVPDSRADSNNTQSRNATASINSIELDHAQSFTYISYEADKGVGHTSDVKDLMKEKLDAIAINNIDKNSSATINDGSRNDDMKDSISHDQKNQQQGALSAQYKNMELEKTFMQPFSHSDEGQSKVDYGSRIITSQQNTEDKFLGLFDGPLEALSADNVRKEPSLNNSFLENKLYSEAVFQISPVGSQGFIADPLYSTGHTSGENFVSSDEAEGSRCKSFGHSPKVLSKMFGTEVDSKGISSFGPLSTGVLHTKGNIHLLSASSLPGYLQTDDSKNFKPFTASHKQEYIEAQADKNCSKPDTLSLKLQAQNEGDTYSNNCDRTSHTKKSGKYGEKSDSKTCQKSPTSSIKSPKLNEHTKTDFDSMCHTPPAPFMKYSELLGTGLGPERETKNCLHVSVKNTETSSKSDAMLGAYSNSSNLSKSGENSHGTLELTEKTKSNETLSTAVRYGGLSFEKIQVTNNVMEDSVKHTSSSPKGIGKMDTLLGGYIDSRKGKNSKINDGDAMEKVINDTEINLQKISCNKKPAPSKQTLDSNYESQGDSFIDKLSFSNLFGSLSPAKGCYSNTEPSGLRETNDEITPAKEYENKDAKNEKGNLVHAVYNTQNQNQRLNEKNQACAKITDGYSLSESIKDQTNLEKTNPSKEVSFTTMSQIYTVPDHIDSPCEGNHTAAKESQNNVLDEIQNSMNETDFCNLDPQIFFGIEDMDADTQKKELDRFESEFQKNQATAVEKVNTQRAEGNFIVKAIMEDLVSMNKQLIKMKREMDIVCRNLGRMGKQDDTSKIKGCHNFGGW